MKQYELSSLAQQDLREISNHIAQDSIASVLRVAEGIEEKCQRLAEMPGMGRRRSELAPELRSFGAAPYLIFYRESDAGIQVLRVLHGARDIDETLFPE